MPGYFVEWNLPVCKQLVPGRQDDDKRVLPHRLGHETITFVGNGLCKSDVIEVLAQAVGLHR